MFVSFTSLNAASCPPAYCAKQDTIGSPCISSILSPMGAASHPPSSGQQPSAPPLRVWITGASGLIGHALLESAPTGWHVFGTTRAQLDLTDVRATRTASLTLRPDVIIHCAALTKT